MVASSLIALYAWRLFVRNQVHQVRCGRASSPPSAWPSASSASRSWTCARSSSRRGSRRWPATSPATIRRVATLGYREPSLVFLTGTELEMLETGARGLGLPEGRAAAGWFSSKGASRTAFRAENERLGLQPGALDPGHGFQYQQRAAARYRRLCGPALETGPAFKRWPAHGPGSMNEFSRPRASASWCPSGTKR